MAYGIDTLYDSQTGDKIIMSASKPAVPDGQTVVLKDGEFRVGGGKRLQYPISRACWRNHQRLNPICI